MKLRTSFFHKTVFKKDLTRFAPVWGCYLIFMLLAVISMSSDSYAYYRLQSVRECITAMSFLILWQSAVRQATRTEFFILHPPPRLPIPEVEWRLWLPVKQTSSR